MKKRLFFSVFAVFSVFVSSQQNHLKGTITYIGNEGFMIESQGKKVLIDALYYSTMTGIFNSDAATREKMIHGTAPFDSTQLLLISHTHDDHYSQQMTIDYLFKNPQSMLVAPSTITDSVKNYDLRKNIISENPVKYQKIDTTINGISVSTFSLVHKLRINIYNVGFFVNIKGFKVFHAGDNVLDDTTEYIRYNIAQYQPDVALLNYTAFWQADAQREFVKKFIKPRFIILMHIPKGQAATVKQQVDDLQSSMSDTSFPPIVVFENSLESCIITDTIEQTNTRISSSRAPDIQIFPNPCKDWGNINSSFSGDVVFYNSMGVLKKRIKLTNPATKINLSDLSSGLYFVSHNGYSISFIKE